MMTRARGFTLIEMMIAIFIALIIFTIGFAAISSTIQARREAEARIHAAESARLFFELLQKDLTGAYPVDSVGVNLSSIVQESAGQKIQFNLTVPPLFVTNDRIEFFTRLDHRAMTDQYVFVRYFVNSLGHLCRQTSTDISAANAFGDATPFDPTDDRFALFDQTFAVLVSTGQWQESTKTLKLSTVLPVDPATTHLQVQIFFMGYNGANVDMASTPNSKRVFMKTFPVPDVFRPVP